MTELKPADQPTAKRNAFTLPFSLHPMRYIARCVPNINLIINSKLHNIGARNRRKKKVPFQPETSTLHPLRRSALHAHHALIDDAARDARPRVAGGVGEIVLIRVNYEGAIDNGMRADQRERHALHHQINVRYAVWPSDNISKIAEMPVRASRRIVASAIGVRIQPLDATQ